MKLFSRKPNVDPSLPPEIQAYAQAEHRERMGMAWLVGLVSLVITVLVLAVLFFGGRWVYRKVTGTEPQKTDTTQTEDRPSEDKPRSTGGSTDTTDGGGAQTDVPAQASTPQTVPSTDSPTTPSSSTLVRTGPEEDL